MMNRGIQDTSVEKLLRQMRDKRQQEISKMENNRFKAMVRTRAKKLKEEKKGLSKAVVQERKDRKAAFAKVSAELEAEKADIKKADEERVKKARAEKKGRTRALIDEAKAIAKVQKTEKTIRIKQEKADRKEKLHKTKELTRLERERLKRRRQLKERHMKCECEIERRKIEVGERNKRKWDQEKFSNMLIDSY
jgi:hypothetical protein